MTLRRPAAIILAVALDLAAGEPPAGWHPVAWLGRALAWAERRAPGRSVADGAAAVTLVTAGAGVVAHLLAIAARRLGWPGILLEALALKPAFALRGLAEATDGVEAALRAGDLGAARIRVGRDLVSRPTDDLEAAEVASAAIESAAENLVDSIAAPVLAYAVGGLPAAWAYRAINTADAMWGYRDARYERFGKTAARLDDLANLVPARLAALRTTVCAPVVGGSAAGAWRAWRRDASAHPSPNAGQVEAAFAGALEIRLGGRVRVAVGVVVRPVLGDGRTPDAGHVTRAVELSRLVGAVSCVVAAIVAALVGRRR